MSVSCHDIEGLLAADTLGELTAKEGRELAAHLEQCSDCSRLQADISRSLNALNAWKQPPVPSELLSETLATLATERAQTPSLALRVQQFFDRLQNQSVTPIKGVLAAACGLMLFLGLMSIEPQNRKTSAAARVGCEGNLENLKEAVESFRSAHQGTPPSDLGELIPRYLITIPNCPHTGFETYSNGYRVHPENPQAPYAIICSGEHPKAKRSH